MQMLNTIVENVIPIGGCAVGRQKPVPQQKPKASAAPRICSAPQKVSDLKFVSVVRNDARRLNLQPESID